MPRTPKPPLFLSPSAHGFVRVAGAAPVVALADPAANAARILDLAAAADRADAALAVFPELSLSGYAIDDLLHQDALNDAVEAALAKLKHESAALTPLILVGAPIRAAGALYNCAVAIHRGAILGIVPKSYLPTYREYYERRQFAAAADAPVREIALLGETIPFGADLLFAASDQRDCVIHAEICEDMWAPAPPSIRAALAGATILANLSASDITIGKAAERDVLIDAHSRRTSSAYIYAAAGRGESTTDVAWDGQVVAFELGEKLAETKRFARDSELMLVDVDVERIAQERRRLNTWRDAIAHHQDAVATARTIPFTIAKPIAPGALHRTIPRFPFAPDDAARLDLDCYEAYNIQVAALTTRLDATKSKRLVIGVSGGLDSTHALIVAARAMDLLDRPRTDIIGVTMPGFATSAATKSQAWALMRALGVDAREISIRPLAEQMLRDLDHPAARGEKVYDVTYENVQAGLRTDYLFRLANHEHGLVVGTGDLSELALGWCTYGVGDHMAHYNVNAGAAKTLIQQLIRWVAAEGLFDAAASQTLRDILDTEISPELVPADATGAIQSTQSIIGPYPLQDFNLHYAVRHGMRPSKILFLAWCAWKDANEGVWPPHYPEASKRAYSYEEIRKWLGVFIERFYGQSQFKRSAMPNGPKLTSLALSPRGDWRAPSDASAATWRAELETNTPETL
ncbi:MAG: NAD(+) synthase [Alphaproteobacteria bacterium]|nr:NAD(+) synthase [Alphaproteobacteria bacterium]